MNYKNYVTLLVATSLLACHQESNNRVEADFSAIMGQLEDIEALMSSGLPITNLNEKYLEFFVDDLVLLPPGGSAVEGRDAALAFFNDVWGGVTLIAVNYETPVIMLEGDMAVRRYVGSGEFLIDAESEPVTGSGRYIDILQRQSDGGWRIVWHTWTQIDR